MTERTIAQHIDVRPDVMGGKPHIVGHRIRVMDIVLWHEKRGLSPDEVLSVFPSITLADIHAALAYYFDHREEIEAEFIRETQVAQALKQRYPSKLQSKLHG